MKTNHWVILIYIHLFCAILGSSAFAAEIEGVKFPDSVAESGKTLTLNGMGVRTYWSFNVYAAALYQEIKSSDENQILDSTLPRVLKMYYFRDVGQGDAIKVWKKSFESYCPGACDTYKASMEKFMAQVKDIKAKDETTYIFQKDSVEIQSKNGTTKIEQSGFPKIVLSTWIGKNPPTEKLKTGLLGK